MQQMASLVSRALAVIIDIAIVLALLTSLSYIFDLQDNLIHVMFYILLVISDAYQGQSIGKRLLNIRVINFKTGQPAHAARTMIRNLFFPLNFLLLPLAINYILYVSYFRMMGDFISGTVVVNTKKTVPDSP